METLDWILYGIAGILLLAVYLLALRVIRLFSTAPTPRMLHLGMATTFALLILSIWLGR